MVWWWGGGVVVAMLHKLREMLVKNQEKEKEPGSRLLKSEAERIYRYLRSAKSFELVN